MTIYMQVDPDGCPLGFWNSALWQTETGDRHPGIPADAFEITSEQHQEFLTYHGLRRWQNGQVVEFTPPGPTADQLMTALRAERDRLLDTTDKAVRRHEDQKALGVVSTVSEQQFTDLLAYRQALRDLPENTVDPANPTWPVDPLA